MGWNFHFLALALIDQSQAQPPGTASRRSLGAANLPQRLQPRAVATPSTGWVPLTWKAHFTEPCSPEVALCLQVPALYKRPDSRGNDLVSPLIVRHANAVGPHSLSHDHCHLLPPRLGDRKDGLIDSRCIHSRTRRISLAAAGRRLRTTLAASSRRPVQRLVM